MSERYLEGRAAVVTGGASGQGRATALALATCGCDVAIGSYLSGSGRGQARMDTYLPSHEELDVARAEIEAQGVRAVGCDHDVRSTESCQALYAAAVDAFGKVDILCNVAGLSFEQPICGHDDADWHNVIDTNLTGYYRMIKLALPSMIERGWGRIVNVASTSANVGHQDNAAYSSAKAGVLGLTRCVALEGAPHGVTCNAINPGFVNTSMLRSAIDTWLGREQSNRTPEQYLAEIEQSYPQKRIIEPEEIGALAAFLCRNEARGLTMEDITVAGGALW